MNKPLKEHYEVDTDSSVMLRYFDYIEDLEAFVNWQENQLLLHSVVGQSEQFYCDQEKTIKRCKNQCMRCNKLWKPKKQ